MPRSVEEFLISAVLNTKDIRTAMANGVNADLFHDYHDEWVWLEKFYARYDRLPGKVAFATQFPHYRHHRTEDLAYYCDQVRENHVRFELTTVLNSAVGFLSDGDIEQAVRVVTTSMVHITAGLGGVDDPDIFTSYDDILADVRARVDRAATQGSSGIPTGIPTFDEQTGGCNPGELVIFGARLGEGKSWILQKIAAHATVAGYNVQFDALEQSRSQVAMRIHALLSGSIGQQLFSNTALMQGKNFSLKDYQGFLRRLKATVAGKLNVSDASRGRVSPLTIASQIERNKPDMVIVDYLTLMATTSPDWQGVAQLSGEMKQLGVSYQIPVLAAAQLNRADGVGRGEPPDAEAVAKSDSIGQDCDILITQRKRSTSVIQQKMAKNRNGPGGFCWWLKFRPGEGVIEEVTGNEAQRLMDADADQADKEAVR